MMMLCCSTILGVVATVHGKMPVKGFFLVISLLLLSLSQSLLLLSLLLLIYTILVREI